MKRKFCLNLVVILPIALFACGGSSGDSKKDGGALSGDNLANATNSKTAVDNAVAAALASSGGSVEKRNDGSLRIIDVNKTESLGTVNYTSDDGKITVTGTWTSSEQKCTVTFNKYTYSTITIDGSVEYHLTESDTSFTYAYNADLDITIDGALHTCVYDLSWISNGSHGSYSGTYDIDGVEYSYSYTY